LLVRNITHVIALASILFDDSSPRAQVALQGFEATDKLGVSVQSSPREPQQGGEQTGRSQVGGGLGDGRDGEGASGVAHAVALEAGAEGEVTADTVGREGAAIESQGIAGDEVLESEQGAWRFVVLVGAESQVACRARAEVEEGTGRQIEIAKNLAHTAAAADRPAG